MYSNALQQQTRELLEGKGDFVPMTDEISFKNDNGSFATMTLGDYLQEKLILTDRKTAQSHSFQSIDELLETGWVVD